MRLRPLFLLPAALLVIGGCGGGGGDTSSNNNPTSPTNPNNPNPTSPAAPIETNAISVSDNTFTPADIKVAPNTLVTWTWVQGASAHNVTISDGSGSGDQSSNYVFSKNFPTAGTFTYRCTIHPSMTGSVLVAP